MDTYEKVVYESVKYIGNDESCKTYETYGIKVVGLSGNNANDICEIRDISLDSQFVEDMINLFNDYKLSKEHFYDCVYDFVAEY